MNEPIEPSRVSLTSIDIPFTALVVFLIKLAFAAVPAAIIFNIIFTALGALIGGVIGGVTKLTPPETSGYSEGFLIIISLVAVFFVVAFIKGGKSPNSPP